MARRRHSASATHIKKSRKRRGKGHGKKSAIKA
jgi:hypothetical protein